MKALFTTLFLICVLSMSLNAGTLSGQSHLVFSGSSSGNLFRQDIDGDGVSDILHLNEEGVMRVFESSQEGSRILPTSQNVLNVSFVDINGDGDDELLYLSSESDGGALHHYDLSGDVDTVLLDRSNHKIVRYLAWPKSDSQDHQVFFTDIDGDFFEARLDHAEYLVKRVIVGEGVTSFDVGHVNRDELLDITYIDAQGDIKLFTKTLSISAPTITTHLSSPTADARPTWSWSSTAGVEGSGVFAYKLNGAEAVLTRATEFFPAVGLADGVYTFEVVEQAQHGFWGVAATASITVSTGDVEFTAPVVSCDQGELTHYPRPTWRWSAESGDRLGQRVFRHRLNGSAWSSEVTNLSFTPRVNLASGVYTLEVQEKSFNDAWSLSGSFTTEVVNSSVSISSIVTKLVASQSAKSLKNTDVNGDSLEDLIFINGTNHIWAFLKDIGFLPINTTDEFQQLDAVDMDGDEDLDVLGLTVGGEVKLVYQIENNVFSTVTPSIDKTGIVDIEPVDFDGNGTIEIIYIDETGDIRLFYP